MPLLASVVGGRAAGCAFGGAGSGVRDSDHVNRRTLPLLLAALLTTSGCVSVTPDNKPPTDRTKVSVPAPASGRRAEEALPLTPLPASQPPAPPVDIAPEDGSSAARAQRAQPAQKTDGLGSGARNVERLEPRSVKPKRSSPQRPVAKAKVKAKPRKGRTLKPSVPRRSRPAAVPAPGRVSMAELCRSSHGVTGPTITELCHSTYR